MLTCPLCQKTFDEAAGRCPRCQTDVSLLADFRARVKAGLERADALARSGELSEAVWTYLEVLEADPEEPTARRQVGRIAAAVRHFDRTSLFRRWLQRLRPGRGPEAPSRIAPLLAAMLALALLVIGFAVGYYVRAALGR